MNPRALSGIVLLLGLSNVAWADAKAEAAAEQYVVKFGGRVIHDVSHMSKGEPVFAVSLDAKDAKGFDMKQLAVFPKLYRLTFAGSSNTDAALKDLKLLPGVTSLSLDDSDVTDEGLKFLADLPKLKDLDLTRAGKLTANGLKALAKCPALETLNVSETAVNAETVQAWAEWKTLRELKICKSKLQLTETAKTFQAWTTLKELDFTGTPIDDKSLVPICTAKNLESLNLTGSTITDFGLRPLNKLSKLKKLHLSEIPTLTGKGFEELDSLGTLETLYLNDSGITDAGMLYIARNRGVKTLDLDRTKVTDSGMRELATPRGLETLSIEETTIGNDGLLEVAAKAKRLAKVNARKSKITPGGAAEAQKKSTELVVSFE